jgi:hypothetical protein
LYSHSWCITKTRARRIDALATSLQRGEGDYKNDMNSLADESQSIEQSHHMVGEIIASRQANLTGLVEQRQKL